MQSEQGAGCCDRALHLVERLEEVAVESLDEGGMLVLAGDTSQAADAEVAMAGCHHLLPSFQARRCLVPNNNAGSHCSTSQRKTGRVVLC